MTNPLTRAREAAWADLAVAMGNASTGVRACAHRVAGTNNEDGWADAVEAILS